MITKENYSEEHIRQIVNENRRDPLLVERTLFAFGLLEALAKIDPIAYAYLIKADKLIGNYRGSHHE